MKIVLIIVKLIWNIKWKNREADEKTTRSILLLSIVLTICSLGLGGCGKEEGACYWSIMGQRVCDNTTADTCEMAHNSSFHEGETCPIEG